jgi:two-component system, chemotaxis family, response regulator Rcp1
MSEFLEPGMDGASRVNILLVDDNPGDVRLTMEAFRENRVCSSVHVARDGVEALAFLHHTGAFAGTPRPDLILLDLNMPRKDGREVLAEIKTDPDLALIPIVVLTTSQSEQDIRTAYGLHANCYISKPVDLDQFLTVVNAIGEFWLTIARLPDRPS